MAEPFERRRYSAVLLTHPKLSTFRDLARLTRGAVGESIAVRLGHAGWSAQRGELLSTRSHYPTHIVNPESRIRVGGYAHDFYCAIRTKGLDGGTVPTFLIASPYIRLLDSLLKTVLAGLDHPVPVFGCVRMEDAVKYFATTPGREIHARRVTMQVFSGIAVDLVSISGRNPLHWELMQAIFTPELAAPYSLGIEVRRRDTTRVNFDRHGNLWWYQADESLLGNALHLVDSLAEGALFVSSRSVPLKRADPEDQ